MKTKKVVETKKVVKKSQKQKELSDFNKIEIYVETLNTTSFPNILNLKNISFSKTDILRILEVEEMIKQIISNKKNRDDKCSSFNEEISILQEKLKSIKKEINELKKLLKDLEELKKLNEELNESNVQEDKNQEDSSLKGINLVNIEKINSNLELINQKINDLSTEKNKLESKIKQLKLDLKNLETEDKIELDKSIILIDSNDILRDVLNNLNKKIENINKLIKELGDLDLFNLENHLLLIKDELSVLYLKKQNEASILNKTEEEWKIKNNEIEKSDEVKKQELIKELDDLDLKISELDKNQENKSETIKTKEKNLADIKKEKNEKETKAKKIKSNIKRILSQINNKLQKIELENKTDLINEIINILNLNIKNCKFIYDENAFLFYLDNELNNEELKKQYQSQIKDENQEDEKKVQELNEDEKQEEQEKTIGQDQDKDQIKSTEQEKEELVRKITNILNKDARYGPNMPWFFDRLIKNQTPVNLDITEEEIFELFEKEHEKYENEI